MNGRRIAVAALVILLAGCGSEQQTELRQWMRDEAKTMRGKVPPLPEIKPFPAVAYEGRTLQMPFARQKIVTIEAVADNAKPDTDRPRQPLENFALEELRVAGVIVRNGVAYALISPPLPNKPVHVREGEYMGTHFGRVVKISTEGVTVLETTKDSNGAWVEREVIKPVPRQGQGAKK